MVGFILKSFFIIIGLFINRGAGQLARCSSNANCDSTSVCLRQVCTDPCDFVDCGPDVECKVEDHQAQCDCAPGYHWSGEECSADSTGQSAACTSNADCDSTMTCLDQVCIDLCSISVCGRNTECNTVDHEPQCSCAPGYTRSFQGCDRDTTGQTAGCSTNTDCNSTLACLNQTCSDPCSDLKCGQNAECKTVDHVAQCACHPGYTESVRGCVRETTVRFRITLQHDQSAQCSSDTDCDSTLACLNQTCSDPCFETECGQNAECRTIAHRALCACPPGYKRNGQGCRSEQTPGLTRGVRGKTVLGQTAGCWSNADCNSTLACLNQVCSDPCSVTDCGQNIECYVENHMAQCAHPPGYKLSGQRSNGDTTGQSAGCTSNADCDSTLACLNQVCIDPCPVFDFGQNAECKTVDHKAQCFCPPGFHWSIRGCVKNARSNIGLSAGCSTNTDCDSTLACLNQVCIDPCSVFNCGQNAECMTVNHKPQCACPPGFLWGLQGCDRDTTVTPPPSGGGECRYHSDCGAAQRCVANSCQNVCPGVCGPDLECTAREHIPYCHCPQGYVLTHVDGRRCQSTGWSPTRTPGYCSKDHDCGTDRKCKDQRCVDPCEDHSCPNQGEGTICYPYRHQAHCLSVRAPYGGEYGEKLFYISESEDSWIGAYQYCREHGMRLVSVNSEAEYWRLKQTNKDKGQIEGNWLIAMNVDGKPKNYNWVDTGAKVPYFRWVKDPVDTETCLTTYTADEAYGYDFKYGSKPCDHKRFYACEYYKYD